MRARALAILVTLGAVAALPAPAFGAKTRTWHARLFSSPDGANIRFSTIAQDGAAAGGKFFADGSAQALYFDGRRLRNFGSRLGPVSSFTGLNDRHQAVGYASSNPAARLANLFGANPDPSLMPRAFFMSGRTIKRLSVPSAAFGLNASGDVAGSFRASDGFLHGFLWKPTARRRGFVDLGVGDARALSDPNGKPRRARGAHAAALPAGALTIVGGPVIWTINPIRDAIVRRVLASNIFLQAVSNTGLASGGQDHPDGSRSPVVVDVDSGRVRMPDLPPGAGSGFAGGISKSTGLASGSVGSGAAQHAEVWKAGGQVVGDPNALPGVSLPPGTEIDNTPAISDTGLMAGFATDASGQQDGVVVTPSPLSKAPLLLKAWDAYLDKWGFGKNSAKARRVKVHIKEALDHWKANHPKLACMELKEAPQDVLDTTGFNFDEAFERWYEHGLDRQRAERLAWPALAVEFRAALAEFGAELDCAGMKKALGLE